ncbi:MAG: hypothetical protein ABFS43_09525 [Thermodesulfobacteriota bacterium]
MDTFKQAISVALVLAMLWSALPVDAAQVEASEAETITEHMPQSRVSDEKEIPDKSSGKWLWIVLGAVVVAGGVAALAGGGGGGSSDSTAEETGSVGVTW